MADSTLSGMLKSAAKWPWFVLAPSLMFVAIAIFSPWLVPYDPIIQDYNVTLEGPSAAHWLGTDYLGRDMLSRLISGTRVSLLAMSIVLVSALLIGVTIGSFAGYVGGKTELILISMIDIILSLPSLIFALAIIGVIGPGYWSMIVALTLAWWANYARMSRAVVVSELHQPYIEAARVMGSGHFRIFFRHIMPHVMALVVVYASADAGYLVLAIATLSFLGLGVEPPTPEWGQMLVDGMSYLEEYPRLIILPGIALTLVVVSFNLLGEQFALQKVPRAIRGYRLKRKQQARLKEERAIQARKSNT